MDSDRTKQLREFVAYAKTLKGDEKGEAQVFLDRLFRAFSRSGYKEAGATLEERVRNERGGTGFADLVWKPVVLIEMKKRGEDLSRHLLQAFKYWEELVPGRPRYVVLCNFDEFRVYDFDQDIHEPQDTVTLDELPERYGPLNFLWPTNEPAHFRVNREKVTRQAADLLATVYRHLQGRKDVGPKVAQRFVLQALVCLFSEDIGLLPKHFFTQLLDECVDPPKAFDLLDGLFRAMNAKDGVRGGRYAPVQYFNGGLFSESAAVELDRQNEVALLKAASTYDWSKVSPDIFGTIFQHSMEAGERHAMGAHYTSQQDIMKIVGPTIVAPFTEAIRRASTLKDLNAIRSRLQTLRVLDPACGSGNFLYIAYREMRRLEAEINRLEVEERKAMKGQIVLGGVSPRQFFGMDILPFAVELAKVTLSIAPKLASDELHTTENPLPLANLDENILVRDALIDAEGHQAEWPAADVIIGNPPFLGAKRLKPERGADYVNKVRKAYADVPGMADYCVYWFRRAHDHLPECTPEDPFAGRAGLVGTQNIRNNKSRIGGLDHIVKTGVIVEAVENQPWSGEANVHVSIANWVKSPGVKKLEELLLIPSPRRLWSKVDPSSPLFEAKEAVVRPRVATPGKRAAMRKDKSYELTVRGVFEINSSLTDGAKVGGAQVIEANVDPQRSFQGVKLGYSGYLISLAERQQLINRKSSLQAVIRPLLIGRDLVTGDAQPTRAVIDFADMDMLKARAFSEAFSQVERSVLREVRRTAAKASAGDSDMGDARQDHLERWWQFWNVRREMRKALTPLTRFIACSQVTKRPIFAFVDCSICPDATLQVFSFDDDYSFGVLQSGAHWSWFVANSSKLTERFRYTRRSVWDTFPWPQSPTKKQVRAVAAAGREIRAIRDKTLPTIKGGLRALYRTLELPGKNPLKDAHATLDAAVLDAFGFSARKDILKQLLDLNHAVAAAIDKGEHVTAPGVPPSYGDASDLITEDCIKP